VAPGKIKRRPQSPAARCSLVSLNVYQALTRTSFSCTHLIFQGQSDIDPQTRSRLDARRPAQNAMGDLFLGFNLGRRLAASLDRNSSLLERFAAGRLSKTGGLPKKTKKKTEDSKDSIVVTPYGVLTWYYVSQTPLTLGEDFERRFFPIPHHPQRPSGYGVSTSAPVSRDRQIILVRNPPLARM